MEQVKFVKEEFGEFILSKEDVDEWILEFRNTSCRIHNGNIYKTSKGIYVISISKYSDVAKELCKIKKVKLEDIYLSIPEEVFQRIKEIEKEFLEARIKEEMEKPVEDWEFGIGGDTWKLRIWAVGIDERFRKDIKEIQEFIEKHQELFEDKLMEKSYDTRPSQGFYTRDGFMYKIKHQDLMEIYNEVYEEVKAKQEMKEKVKREEVEKIIAKAKETGEPQLLYSFSTECNDPDRECSIDNIYVYIDGNGKQFTKRVHTY